MKAAADNKRTIVQIEYDAEKLEALRFYLGERKTTLENELADAMESIFKKNVPAQVRGYINRNNTKACRFGVSKHNMKVKVTQK